MDIRAKTSSQMVDLAKRPISVSYEIVKALENAHQPCKVIAARVMAARAILKAAEGSGTHLEQVLDRTEGRVPSGELTGGSVINFNFSLQPGEPGVRQVGEVIQGVLASAVNTNDEVGQLPAGQLQVGVNPPAAQSSPINHLTARLQLIDKNVDK